jgi:hypothetical protein
VKLACSTEVWVMASLLLGGRPDECASRRDN